MDLLNPDADDPEFFARWNEWYQDVPPLGSMLREDYPERWLRIHSLPESKRYPDSDSEYAELLVRQNAAATAVLGPDAHCILVLFAPCDADLGALSTASGLDHVVRELRYAGPLERWLSEQYFGGPMCFYSASMRWKAGSFDGFIRSTAEGLTKGLVVELERGQVYAPYDGGADLLFATEFERNLAETRFSMWTSYNSDGLERG